MLLNRCNGKQLELNREQAEETDEEASLRGRGEDVGEEEADVDVLLRGEAEDSG